MSTPVADSVLPRAVRLAELFHHRWAVPVLAELQLGNAGGRFAPLVRSLGAGRAVLKRTLESLDEQGLTRANPGYGHPLRPEVVLTAAGRALGPWTLRFLRAVRRGGFEGPALHKWSMPVLLAVHRGRSRFSEIQSALPDITARSLTLALKELQEAGLVARVVVDDYPPRVRYRLTRRARRVARVLAEL